MSSKERREEMEASWRFYPCPRGKRLVKANIYDFLETGDEYRVAANPTFQMPFKDVVTALRTMSLSYKKDKPLRNKLKAERRNRRAKK